jgi:hypothetical protein
MPCLILLSTVRHCAVSLAIYYFLFQGARHIASSRRSSCSVPPHESASRLHASASSYPPLWGYPSAIRLSLSNCSIIPIPRCPIISPIGPLGIGMGIGGRPPSPARGLFSISSCCEYANPADKVSSKPRATTQRPFSLNYPPLVNISDCPVEEVRLGHMTLGKQPWQDSSRAHLAHVVDSHFAQYYRNSVKGVIAHSPSIDFPARIELHLLRWG